MNQNQKALHELWEEHIRHEFATHDTEETLATTEAEMLREVGEIRDRLARLEETIKRLQHG